MMDAQLANYLSNLTTEIHSFIKAYLALEDRFQEAFDRDVPAELPTVDFSQAGDLDHLTSESLGDAFAAFLQVKALIEEADREVMSALYEVVR